MKLAKNVTALIAATGLSLALLTGCSKATGGEPAIQQDVIVAAIEGAPGHSVDFKVVSPQGTNAVTVCPFQNLQLLKQGLGFNWSGAADIISDDESTNALIFTDGMQVVAVARLERATVNLCHKVPGGTALKFGSAYTFTSELNSDGSAAWTLQE